MNYIPKGHRTVFFFTLFYIVAFSIGFFIGGDYEFVIYTAVMFGVLLVVTLIVREYEIPNPFLWVFSFAGVLHMLGGGIHVGGQRLYGVIIYPFYISATDPGFQIFRYDQLVHIFGYGVIALCIHYALRTYYPMPILCFAHASPSLRRWVSALSMKSRNFSRHSRCPRPESVIIPTRFSISLPTRSVPLSQ